MDILTGAFLIVAIIFMCVFIFIGIWSFIVFLKSFRQSRYRNYILEKIYQKLSIISDSLSKNDEKNNYAYLTGEEDIFEINEDNKNIDNIAEFTNQEKLK